MPNQSPNPDFLTPKPVMNAPWLATTTPELVAEMSSAGGLGVMPCGFFSPEKILQTARCITSLTDKSFALCLDVRPESGSFSQKGLSYARCLDPLREELSLPPPEPEFVSFEEQFEAVLETGVKTVLFTNGGPREIYAERLDAAGISFGGLACSPRDAKALFSSGASFVIAQGLEAGGVFSAFETPWPSAPLPLSVLIPVISRIAHGRPVFAFGAIMSRAHAKACADLGASGFVLGSALTQCAQCALPEEIKNMLRYTDETASVVTDVLTGKASRILRNALTDSLNSAQIEVSTYPEAALGFSDIYRYALEHGMASLACVPMEPNAYLASKASVREIVESIVDGL